MSPERTDGQESGAFSERDPADDGGRNRDRASPRSTAIRNWTLLAAFLALSSFATAAGIVSIGEGWWPALGAATLGVVFAGVAAAPFVGGAGVLARLDDAWSENRLYAGFATGLFAVGIVLGAGVYLVAGVDLVELIGELLLGEFEDGDTGAGGQLDIEFSAMFFITNNTPPFLVAILGGLTLGLVTAVVMVFNGFLIGNLAIVLGGETGFGIVLALIVPHGVFELAALFVASGIGFRFAHRAVQRFLGGREALFTSAYLVRTGLLIAFTWLVLVLAAFVEAYLTIPIAEFFFPGG